MAAARALDRVLLWNHYVVPQWHYPYDRLAFWDVFGRPDKLPSQATSVLRSGGTMPPSRRRWRKTADEVLLNLVPMAGVACWAGPCAGPCSPSRQRSQLSRGPASSRTSAMGCRPSAT